MTERTLNILMLCIGEINRWHRWIFWGSVREKMSRDLDAFKVLGKDQNKQLVAHG